MKRWAVTGPVGAGKSFFAALLAKKGAVLVDGDTLGHEVLKMPTVQSEIDKVFGSGLVVNGVVDRVSLGGLVFGNRSKMQLLNQITHGRLADLASSRMAQLEDSGNHQLAVFEAAVYFLLPETPDVDLVISVIADDDVRIARLMAKRKLDEQQAEVRLEAQAFMDNLWQQADVVVHNNGSEAELDVVASELWDKYM